MDEDTTDIKEIFAHGRVRVAGRGDIYLCEFPNPDKLKTCPGLPKVGETVLVNGRLAEVRGIEASMKLLDPSFMSENVGLLLRFEDEKGTI